MLVLFIFLSTCVGKMVDMLLATQNLVFSETVCCLYFTEGLCPVCPWIVSLSLTSIKYTLSGSPFLSGLTLLQFERRCFHLNASDLCVKYCWSVYHNPAQKTTSTCEV